VTRGRLGAGASTSLLCRLAEVASLLGNDTAGCAEVGPEVNDYLEPSDVTALLEVIPASLKKLRLVLENAAARGEGFDLSGWEREQRLGISGGT
jgi:hypothetical protein